MIIIIVFGLALNPFARFRALTSANFRPSYPRSVKKWSSRTPPTRRSEYPRQIRQAADVSERNRRNRAVLISVGLEKIRGWTDWLGRSLFQKGCSKPHTSTKHYCSSDTGFRPNINPRPVPPRRREISQPHPCPAARPWLA